MKEVKEQIREFKKKGVSGILFTGGEPTLYEELPEAIEYCVSEGLEPRMITNGQKLSVDAYAKVLAASGITNVNVSLYSYKKEVQERITRTPGSFDKSLKGIENTLKYMGHANINIAITSLNIDHLSDTVKFIHRKYPQIHHFVFNYLLIIGIAQNNLFVVPKLVDAELELKKTAHFLKKHNITFRMERVPLCYMGGFEECATETRQIVKDQPYLLYLLRRKKVEKAKVRGEDKFYEYSKADCCKSCFLTTICAGLDPRYARVMGTKELYPVFKDLKTIISKIRS